MQEKHPLMHNSLCGFDKRFVKTAINNKQAAVSYGKRQENPKAETAE